MTELAAASPDLYFDTIFAYQRAGALKSALDLNLFTAIDEGAHTAAELAGRCQAPVRGIRILCDYLTTIAFLTKSGDRYDLTADTATFLSRRSPAYLGGTAEFLYSPKLTGYFARLTDTIRRGRLEDDTMVADENPEWVQFARAMVPMMMPAAQAIADLLGTQPAPRRVLDLAAGHGIFGIVLAQRHPQAEVVAQDWASVLEVATEHARAMGVGDRHRTLPGSAFDVDYGTGYDVILVTNFLHHFNVETNVVLLRKVHGALVPGGRVVVLEFVLNEDRVSPPMAARFSLTMLSNTPEGDAYTFSELRRMLLDAGFRETTLHALPGAHSVVLGVK